MYHNVTALNFNSSGKAIPYPCTMYQNLNHNLLQMSKLKRLPSILNTPRYNLVGARMSKAPVPLALGLPITILAAGLVRSSKSPWRVASDRKATVVSNDALSSGEDLAEIPVRLNGLKPPA